MERKREVGDRDRGKKEREGNEQIEMIFELFLFLTLVLALLYDESGRLESRRERIISGEGGYEASRKISCLRR